MKRANGEGCITKIKNRKLRKPYRVSVALKGQKTPGGCPKRQVLDYFATRPEAEEFLAKYLRNPIKDLNITLGQLYENWYKKRERKVETKILSRKSLDCNRSAWERLKPLENERVRSIGTDDLQDIIDACAALEGEDYMSISAIEKVKSLACMLWDFAIQMRIVDVNFAKYVDLPARETNKQQDKFSEIEMAHIKKAARDGVEWADCILMMCYTGLRIDEFLSLKKFGATLDENLKVLAVIGGSKTEAGKNRQIPVHDIIEPYFRAWYQKTDSEYIIGKLTDGKSRKNGNSKYNVNWWRKNCYYAAIDNINGNGQKIRKLSPHACRHTFISMCEMSGMSPTMRLLISGHKDDRAAKTYTHAELSERQAAISVLK